MARTSTRLKAILAASLLTLCCTSLFALDADSDLILGQDPSPTDATEQTQVTKPEPALRGPALLAITAVVALGGYFYMRKLRHGLSGNLAQRSSGAIEICRMRPLGKGQHLAVVQVEGKRLLLGIGPGFITNLTELEPEDFSIPFERKSAPTTPKVEPTGESEDKSLPFNNLITRINESLNRQEHDRDDPSKR
ncbi:MAG: flagellar biosynthetic protein FliO [Opitutales bacterium]|nr:flagellar biosynthetic protein FliO [Opitutales bacterium]